MKRELLVFEKDEVPEKDERLTLEQYYHNILELGTLGHDAKLLWLDPLDGTIPFAGAFWDIFDSVAVSPPDSHVGDDFIDMNAELKAQYEQLPTMTLKKKQALLGKGLFFLVLSNHWFRGVCHVGERCCRLPQPFAVERPNFSDSEGVGD
jgi:hypothetical protein